MKFVECCINLKCDLQQFLRVDGCDWKEDMAVSLSLLMNLCLNDADNSILLNCDLIGLLHLQVMQWYCQEFELTSIVLNALNVTEMFWVYRKIFEEPISDFKSLIFPHILLFVLI